MTLWPLRRLGLVSEAKARGLWTRHMGWTVRGWTRREAAAAFAWIAEHYVQPLVRPDVMGRVRDHQEAGHRVIDDELATHAQSQGWETIGDTDC